MLKPTSLRALLAIAAFNLFTGMYAQVPETDLFLFQLTPGDTGKWHVHSPVLLSSFNDGGYTNQPAFFSENEIYVSVRMRGSDQNDIYSLDVAAGTLAQVTDTPEGEYSPTLHPDKIHFSCIREVLGDEINQQLYIYPLDRSDNGQSIDRSLRNVGYHAWLSPELLGLFLVGEENSLALYNTGSKQLEIFASNIGRAIKVTDEGKLAFVHKFNSENWFVKILDPVSKSTEILVQTPAGAEDFTIAPNGDLFIGQGSTLLVFDPDQGNEWRAVADLAPFGINRITRLAVNTRNQLIIVSSKT